MSRLLLNTRRDRVGTAPPPRPADDVHRFHTRLAGYRPTELVEIGGVEPSLGAGRVLLKAETSRFGLPSFKVLGASWATYRLLVERLGDEPEMDTLDDLATVVHERLGRPTLVAATDGNHGRAVAFMARRLGLASEILVPAGTTKDRIDGISSEGAGVTVVDGTYDDAVAAAAARASDDRLVVSDTSWPGYEDVPRWVIEGYSTMFVELDQQLERHGGWPAVDVVVVPLGVGALGAAAAGHLQSLGQDRQGLHLVGVEPDDAACCLAAIEATTPVLVDGPHRSIMAGLNCGLASPLALPTLARGLDAVVTISDDQCRAAMRWLANHGLDAGECSAAGVAALGTLRTLGSGDLAIPEDATALIVATEGVTDAASFEAIVGRPPRGRA